jgi:uncharacterized protein
LNAIADHSEAETEGKLTAIIRDADMLDGLGAIGIMRACTSKATLPDYNPDNFIPPIGQRRDTTICGQIAFQMEWYDPGFMQTATGKRLAKKRFEFMKTFLKELESEVNGRDLN